MQRALRISLLVNLALTLVVLYQGVRPRVEVARQDQVASVPPETFASQLNSNPAAQPSIAGHFDWGQVEATDYPTYIANLRGIKCPEQTVRDIIKADVANLFALRRRTSPGPTQGVGRWSPAEEARLMTALFGDPEAAGTSYAGPADSLPETQEPARMPLVLQSQALGTLNLNDEQRQELAQLAHQFVEEIGGVNQDPNDPAYLANWQKAQPKFDELIVRAIGRRAMVDLDQAIPPADDGNE